MSNDFTLKQWVDTKSDVYNLDIEFEHQIKPLLKDILDRCHRIGLPFIATFVVQQDEERAAHCTTAHMYPTSRVSPALLNTYTAIEEQGLGLIKGIAMVASAASDKAEKGNL
jgi:hypothetical protein